MDKEKINLTEEQLIQGIKNKCEQGERSKLQVVKWVKDNSDLGLREAKELTDDYFFYKKSDE